MRRWRMGSLTLGLILIGLGCGFILSKLGIIASIIQILSWWPIAIILLGVEVLFGGFLFTDERCKFKFDGFSVLAILLTLFICAGSFVVSSLPVRSFNLMLPNSNIFYSDNSIFQKSITVNASGKEGLVVNNSYGSVQLIKSSGSSIEIEASIMASYNDYATAKAAAENLIKVTEGNIINISSDKGPFQNEKVSFQGIDYIIRVPEKLNAEVFNKFGKVEAANIGGNLTINNTNGSINVNSISGSLKVQNKFGEIIVSEVSGAADIKNENGKIKAENMLDSLAVENRFGEIELKNASGTVDVKNENGAITFSSDKVIENDVKLEGKFGNITLNLNKQQEGSFNLYTRHGGIKTSLPISVNKDNTSESANMSIGSSKNQFNVRNENGAIVLNKN